MNPANSMGRLLLLLATAMGLWATLLTLLTLEDSVFARPSASATIGDVPVLINPGFECDVGVYTTTSPAGSVVRIASGWTYTPLVGDPDVQSARIFVHRSSHPNDPCAADAAHVERLEGRDSSVAFARDIEKPPLPGKPFDVVLYQRISATVGTDYSVSGWMLSLCGGTANDCPEDAYIAKMLGVDPTGGVDPQAETVEWVESRAPHALPDGTRLGWVNLRTSAVVTAAHGVSGTWLSAGAVVTAAPAVSGALTIFARLNSPFQWHGNHGYIDALSVVAAPTIALSTPPTVTQAPTLTLSWASALSPDILAIPGGNYRALVDLEARYTTSGTWRSLVQDGVTIGEIVFTAPCRDALYQFRARARAEQPEGESGVFPNHRYPGSWSAPVSVLFAAEPFSPTNGLDSHQVYLPVAVGAGEC